MKTIILDTNALMAIGGFKLGVFSELDRVCDFNFSVKVLDKTIEELEKIIREQGGKDKRNAELALEIIKKKKIGKIKTDKKEGYVDDVLVELAKKGAIVVTQDKELKARVKEAGGKVMTIRQKRKIIWG